MPLGTKHYKIQTLKEQLNPESKAELMKQSRAPYGQEPPPDKMYKALPTSTGYTTQQLSGSKQRTWKPLIQFEQFELPPTFPLEVLPPATREFVYAASETVQAPVDMMGVCVLGVLEIACHGRYPVCLPNGHIERPCLYTAPIARPSERKSGVIEVVTRPIVEHEIEYNKHHSGEVNQNRSSLKILQGRIANTEQQAIKEKDSAKRQAAEWAGKLHGNMTRFAGLIHSISAFEQGKNPLDTKINADEAQAAVALARYYLEHAKTVYMEQAEPPEISNARYLWEKIKSIKSIGKRELIRKTQGKQEFNLDESLSILIERGYVLVEHTKKGAAGRPSEQIIINPEAHNIVTKLTLSTDNTNLVNKVNKVTIPLNVPNVKAAVNFKEEKISETEESEIISLFDN